MGKASSMAIVCALVLPLLLSRRTSLVAAVDITFVDNFEACTGIGVQCTDIPVNFCCGPEVVLLGSVLVSNFEGCGIGVMFDGGQCTGLAGSTVRGDCVTNGTFTGALWSRVGCTANDSETYKVPNTCKAQIKPDSLVYLDDSAKGQWVLTTNDTTELFLQMQNAPRAEVADWLETHGATFESSGL